MEPYLLDNAVRLYNLDCIEGAKRSLEDKSVDLLIADPPFAIAERRLASFYNKYPDQVIPGYVFAPAHYAHFCLDWMIQAYRVLKEHGSMYVVSGWSKGHIVQDALLKIGFVLINEIIYQYDFPCVAKHKFNSAHFRIYYCKKTKHAQPFFDPHCRFQVADKDAQGKALHYQDRHSVWHIKKASKRRGKKNLAQLPVELVRKMLAYSSAEGFVVGDFFSGGGTVPLQAYRMNRRVVGFEKNPAAFQHIVTQFEATLASATRV